MAHLTDMEELVSSIKNENIRDYMRESLACYMAGAYRASVVLTFIALFDDIIEKLGELGKVNKKAKVIFEAASQKRIDQDVFETYLIDQLKSNMLFSTLDAEFLEILRKLRNKAAHPSGHHASAEEARFVYHQAVSRFLSRPILSTTQLADEILASLSNANLFPSINIDIITKVVKKELENIHYETYPYLILKILDKTQETDNGTARNSRFFLAGMARAGDLEAASALKKYVIEKKISNTAYKMAIFSLLCSNGKLFSDLDEVTYHRFSVLVTEQIKNVEPTIEHTSHFHPAALFVSLLEQNPFDFVIEKLGTQFDAFLERFAYSAYFCSHISESGPVKPLLLKKYYERAGSNDYQTANSFMKNISDIEKTLAEVFSPEEAFKLIMNITHAANRGAFSAIDIRNASFGTIQKFKKLATQYLDENTDKAKIIASDLLYVSAEHLDQYLIHLQEDNPQPITPP
ncbi:hypothetical protein HX792_25545 [Pseudomonas sp. B6002]|uniref:hypothetical protein n=1 Tax=Pseudomonas sp. B6002 TaxID=2726978 RepID=UPI0015A4CD3A|nr:hypothetical protein [Pseudomonas sp. B6002]NVZ53730.1 hypothetical protein [Pseudomonas sp. B6002]